jgi:hypothetical protein
MSSLNIKQFVISYSEISGNHANTNIVRFTIWVVINVIIILFKIFYLYQGGAGSGQFDREVCVAGYEPRAIYGILVQCERGDVQRCARSSRSQANSDEKR